MRDQSSPSRLQNIAVLPIHDVNNKLGVIIARCDLLATHSQLGERASADLDAIKEAAQALAVMVHTDNASANLPIKRG